MTSTLIAKLVAENFYLHFYWLRPQRPNVVSVLLSNVVDRSYAVPLMMTTSNCCVVAVAADLAASTNCSFAFYLDRYFVDNCSYRDQMAVVVMM